jgi:predicted solute-binding protein
VQHLLRLRDAQDQTGGFLSFIPLPFHPGKTGIKSSQRFTSAVDDLKTISVSRLMLDNIPHIKAYWVMLTEEVASVALNFGADDIDGTVGGEKIAHNAGAITPMKLAEDQIVKIILDAKKIPVKRDIYYNPISVSARRVIGKIPYLNSVPFYHNLKQGQFKLLPVVPRRMGMLLEKNMVDAGLFSLVDFLRHREVLERLNYGIATRDQVRSVMLFSKYGWADLEGRTVGITDETATSVLLLRVLLETKYSVKSKFKRMGSGSEGEGQFDAVLLIGDSALKCVKSGLGDYDLVYDLATEWYQWQKLPFVFAVWAVRKDIPIETRTELEQAIGNALESNSGDYTECAAQHSRQIGWTTFEAIQYLEGFNYHLGEQELRAIEIFEQLGKEIEVQLV